MEKECDLPTALGAVILLVIFGSIALAAAGGWSVLAATQGTTWAAWVQAIGSIGAIGVAIYLGRRSEVSEAKSALGHAYVYRANVLASCAMALKGVLLQNTNLIRDAISTIDDAIDFGRNIRVDRLSDVETLRLSQVRTQAAIAARLLREFNAIETKFPVDWPNLGAVIKQIESKVASIGATTSTQ